MRIFLNVARVTVWVILVTISLPIAWQVATNGTTLQVTGTSMTPTYLRGDVLFVHRVTDPKPGFWEPGKVVVVVFSAAEPEENRYVHRVVKVLSEDQALLKGDGNPDSDVSPVTLSQVYGVPVFRLASPWAGIYLFSQSLSGRLLLFGLGISTLILIEVLAKRQRASATHPGPPGAPELEES